MTRYPIYVISKGRADRPLTSNRLTFMGVPHYVVIEPTEVEAYSKKIDRSRLLVLPFHDLGQGSIPARNWVWEHSLSGGHARHWILDDNIEAFHRLHQNHKYRVDTDAAFRVAEDFTDRYTNVGLAGFQYYCFAVQTEKMAPFRLNTRIYSCILVDNSLPFRWRGKYNEDTDLSLRVLKSGLCTVLFNAFLAGKKSTMSMKGGNTDNVYNDGTDRRAFAESLREQHPDVVQVVWRYNRWHHEVDYSPFKGNELKLRDGVVPPVGVNEYGMKLVPSPDCRERRG